MIPVSGSLCDQEAQRLRTLLRVRKLENMDQRRGTINGGIGVTVNANRHDEHGDVGIIYFRLTNAGFVCHIRAELGIYIITVPQIVAVYEIIIRPRSIRSSGTVSIGSP